MEHSINYSSKILGNNYDRKLGALGSYSPENTDRQTDALDSEKGKKCRPKVSGVTPSDAQPRALCDLTFHAESSHYMKFYATDNCPVNA